MRKAAILSLVLALPLFWQVRDAKAQSSSSNAVPITIDNFARAESDLYKANSAKEAGLGKLNHRREPARIDDQIVIRLNLTHPVAK
jgi:hypothetical protein